MGHQSAAPLTPTATDLPVWHQVNLHFASYAAREATAITHLSTLATSPGIPDNWFFIRKHPWWRLRFHARPDQASSLYHHFHQMTADGTLAEWILADYEPETRAFGGTHAIRATHDLFTHDSRHVLAYLTDRHAHPDRADQRDQISLLLCTLMLRTAGMDWYEQGDVWDRVAKHRNLPPGQAPSDNDLATVRRLLQLDTTSLLNNGHLAWLRPWARAYATAGTSIGVDHAAGRLQRGPRAVLAHHVLFAWNRIGLPATAQATLAHAAATTVFDD